MSHLHIGLIRTGQTKLLGVNIFRCAVQLRCRTISSMKCFTFFAHSVSFSHLADSSYLFFCFYGHEKDDNDNVEDDHHDHDDNAYHDDHNYDI